MSKATTPLTELETRYKVQLTFTSELLGTVPKDTEIYDTYIASKVHEEVTMGELLDELETVPLATNEREKGWTGFHMRNGVPFLLNYHLKGFFKEACGMLRRVRGTQSSGVKAYKKFIDGLVFVDPRELPLILPDGKEISTLDRVLRASTAQGERTTITRSDICPAGTKVEFTLVVLGDVSETLLREWLDYGARHGLGQWRNAGYGTFTYTMTAI